MSRIVRRPSVIGGRRLVDLLERKRSEDADIAYGIYMSGGVHTVIDNQILNATTGTIGITQADGATVACIRNVITGYTIATNTCAFESGNLMP